MGTFSASGRVRLLRRIGGRLRATLAGVVGDRERSRRSSYLIRGQGDDGQTRVVGGNSGNI